MSEEVAVAPERSELGAEAVRLLQALIRIDTTNPPGNEEPAQRLLAETLEEAGFRCELLAAEEGRPNLVARLAGDAAGPTLTLLGHVDTVPADRSEWSFDPWSGELADGEVRGRGAQDMKGQVAAEVAAAVTLGRSGWRPRGDLLVVITADEEMGAGLGARWLCEEHPDKVRSEFVVNEGGGTVFEVGGRRYYPIVVGEKGVFRFKLRTRGRAGHASVPALGDNALLKLAPLLERLREQPPLEPTREGLDFLSALHGERVATDGFESALERLREEAPLIAAYGLEPMVRVTVAPTKVRASEKENVIPSRAEALVDCRVPLGFDEDAVRSRVEPLLGDSDGAYEIEFAERVPANRSPFDTPLASVIRGWLERNDPDATLVPALMPGFSDSHWFRSAFDAAVVYGFCPQRDMTALEAAPLVHAPDERVRATDLEYAARFFHDIATEVLG